MTTVSAPDVPGPVRPRELGPGRRALVVGLGSSGRAAARLLATVGVEVVLVDDRPDHPAADEARAAGHEVVLGRPAVASLRADTGVVVPSPGVPETAPVLAEAVARGVPVWSEPELAMRVRRRRLLAVTGTNGKTSTTELLTAMVRAADRSAVACGNIGLPVSDAVLAAPDDAVLVAELSSFQLRFAGTLRPEVALLLNLAQDHLDWHADMAAYGAAKARIWEAQQPGDWAVANADDAVTSQLLEGSAPAGRASFSGHRSVTLGVGRDGDRLVASFPDGADVADVGARARGPMPSGPVLAVADIGAGSAPHVVANTAAAATAALLAGVPVDAVAAAARRYRPGAHRLELVATRGDGVQFVDDSKATNVHAAVAALRSATSVVWVAGGLAKGADLTPLGDHLGAVHAAVLLGAAAPALASVCRAAGVAVHLVDDMDSAVAVADRLARPGDTVLLAPACASFDQFRDYADRGERFASAARRVTASAPSEEAP